MIETRVWRTVGAEDSSSWRAVCVCPVVAVLCFTHWIYRVERAQLRASRHIRHDRSSLPSPTLNGSHFQVKSVLPLPTTPPPSRLILHRSLCSAVQYYYFIKMSYHHRSSLLIVVLFEAEWGPLNIAHR